MQVTTVVPSERLEDYPGEPTPLFRDFIADLRSGKITQTKGVLWRVQPDSDFTDPDYAATHGAGMCCIGVGARRVSIARPDVCPVSFGQNGVMLFNGNDTIAGVEVYDSLFGDRHYRKTLNPDDPSPLWITGLSFVEMSTTTGAETASYPLTWDALNDSHNLTFTQIADILCWAAGTDQDGYPV